MFYANPLFQKHSIWYESNSKNNFIAEGSWLSVGWARVGQIQQRNPALLLRAKLLRSNVGQVAHVMLTPWLTSQEADITHRAPEAACWLWLGCWCNNSTNSHPSLGPFNRRVLLRSEIPRGICAKLRTVAARNNRVDMPWSLFAYAILTFNRWHR